MSSRGQSRVSVLTVVIAAVLGLAAGLGIVVFTAGDSADQTNLASMADVQLPEATDAAEDAAPSEPSQPSEPAETSEPDTGAEADGVLASCVEAATLADDAVAAGRRSLGNWKTHYGAQIAFDRGRITADEARQRWADSKAPAQKNIDAFVAARDAVPGDDPCAEGQLEGLSDADVEQAQQCSARLAAFSDVMAASDRPMKAWRGHLEMMATRDQYPIDEYLAIWRQTVTDAPGPMRDFEAAVKAYDDAGDCQPEQAASRHAPVALQTADGGGGSGPASPAAVVCVLAPRHSASLT